jgi:hypothetical protein
VSSPVYPVNNVFTRDARLLVPLIIAIAAWTVFTSWNGYTFFSTLFAAADPRAVDCNNRTGILNNWNRLAACNKETFASLFSPAIISNSFWGLASALAFGAAMAAPLSELKTTRLTIGGTALAMMIGRLFDTGFDGLLGAAFSFLKVPQVLLFFITPFYPALYRRNGDHRLFHGAGLVPWRLDRRPLAAVQPDFAV